MLPIHSLHRATKQDLHMHLRHRSKCIFLNLLLAFVAAAHSHAVMLWFIPEVVPILLRLMLELEVCCKIILALG